MTFKQFIAKLRPKVTKKIRIEVPAEFAQQLHDSANREVLKEATRETVGRYTARRDPPHFQGDEYHGHAELPGGYEASWGVSGKRRHPTKFPAAVPADARVALAKVLGVDADLLEGFLIYDNQVKETVLLLELKVPLDSGPGTTK